MGESRGTRARPGATHARVWLTLSWCASVLSAAFLAAGVVSISTYASFLDFPQDDPGWISHHDWLASTGTAALIIGAALAVCSAVAFILWQVGLPKQPVGQGGRPSTEHR
ncbi:hypothetical protein SAMN06295909_0474 [Plantibacter sp. VKM Ac-1784]|uniref:Uncharacterized protein n=1 Tax=Plantibacter elymi (nom. nud.) TaxID=199708 RepID=A0ABY1R929_9MICO|nr:hypothetical protein [Plantibacter sp. VKM Ac-1784]SMQ60624.1 hypothetical protein SAMN06295909_0474 [Plantibacter sp. VKM Ac-1784]